MRRGLALALCALALPACAGGGASPPRVRELAAGPPSRYASIRVSSGARSAEVPADLQRQLAPLLVTRVLPPRDPAEYGLDRPQASLTYVPRRGATFEVIFGSTNFDHHFLYARQPPGGSVFLVPADTVRPVLSLAGLELPPPG